VVRIPIPKLSEERRKDLVKVVKTMTEEARVAVRNARRDANAVLDKMLKDKAIPEDEVHRRKDEIQKITDEFVKKADEAQAKKESEILSV
jgi:ribosome recycling factor